MNSAELVEGLAAWAAERDTDRRTQDKKLRETIGGLSDWLEMSEGDVLWWLWDQSAVSVFPRVSQIVRWVEGRLIGRDAE